MTERVTLELSEDVTRRAKQAAERTGRSFEAVLTEWLERSSVVEDIAPLVPGAEYPIYTPLGNEAIAQKLWEALKETDGNDAKQD
jgi:hypothetical protein